MMPISPTSRPSLLSRPQAQRGSVLLMVAIVLLLLISAWVPLSQAQVMHAGRLVADYGKLQAIYAAEAGVYARLDCASDLSASLVNTPQSQIGYVAVQKVYPDGTWIESTGSAVLQNYPYRATAKAQVLLGKIMKWDLGGS